MGSIVSVEKKAPIFSLSDQDGKKIKLSDFSGKWVVLYFYPRDNTPGCTIEAKEFTASLKQFNQMEAVILGVSPDSLESHQKFIQKQKLKIILLSDPNHQVMEKYGVWGLKKFMGKEFMGVIRSTFLIDPKGKVAHVWTKVKVAGHVEEVKAQLKTLGGK